MGNETKKGNNSGAANTPAITKEDRAKIIEKAAEELKAKAAEVTQQAVAAPPPPLTNKDGLTKEQLEEALKEAKEKGQQVMIKMLEQAIVDFPTVLPGAGAKKAPTDKNARIKLIQKDNPKRGASRQRYAHYKDGMTVGEYVERVGSKGMPDIRWDLEHGFIQLIPTNAPAAPATTEEKKQ